MTRTSPNIAEFEKLAADATVIPVWREIVADNITPVVAFATLGGEQGSYLLESVTGGETWARYSFVGCNPRLIMRAVADRVQRIDASGVQEKLGVDIWDALREELRCWKAPKVVDEVPRFWGGAVGYVSYDAVRDFEPTVGAAMKREDDWVYCFGFGGAVIAFDNVRGTLRIIVPALICGGKNQTPRQAYDEALAEIERIEKLLQKPVNVPVLGSIDTQQAPELPPASLEKDAFEAIVRRAKENIREGDIFQVVLSRRFEVPLGKRDVFEIYRRMRVINPSPYMYFLRMPDVTIAGASPETLVRLENGEVHVRPIAGTRRRGRDAAEDTAIEKELLSDPKEIAEHVMLVDLGRNDVGRISEAGSVSVSDRMIIERYSHVMHIVSNVEGKLRGDRDALDVLRATFPAGTLSGAPKVRAMQIIDELEPTRRGIYGGAIGYIGFDGNMDVAIAIRTVVAKDGKLLMQAGAGIVEASDPALEYKETVNKAKAALIAIGKAT